MARYYIYVLLDPRTNEVRYVGKTQSLELRRVQHERMRHPSQAGLAAWFDELRAASLHPKFEVWAIVYGSYIAGHAVEKSAIVFFSGQAKLAPLLNIRCNPLAESVR